MPIFIATPGDIPALVSLLNSTFRGDASKKGWTTEADLLKGDLRTDEPTLTKLMQTPEAVFLKYVNEENEIQGCVFLDIKEKRLYLGMLSVSAMIQAKGIGKQLMAAATEHAIRQHCTCIFMRVISIRKELVEWYERQGYIDSGKREPFPTDQQFGIPTQPLEFIIMEKENTPCFMSLLIREILPEDATAITELSHQLGYPIAATATKENIEILRESMNDGIWAAFSDKKIAGWIHVFKTTRVESGTFGEIGGLVVSEGYRRKGIGKLLVEQAKQWCINRNIPALRVRCNSKRTEAHIFYTSLKFHQNKEQKVFEIALRD